jgi:hypothetical protein
LRGEGFPLGVLLDGGIGGVAGGGRRRFVRVVLPDVVTVMLEVAALSAAALLTTAHDY